jgi:MoxR-like ATPase
MHPDKQTPASKPGFMMVATANGIDMEGRSAISPAIIQRVSSVDIKGNYTQPDLTKIMKHLAKKHHYQDTEITEMAQTFRKLKQEYRSYLNLRMFEDAVRNRPEVGYCRS